MKLSKKFWNWLSQVVALILLLVRADLTVQALRLIPGFDTGQLFPAILLFVIVVVAWSAWLVWRAIDGFRGSADFLTDVGGHWR